jgi:hypothetical protein
MLLPVVFFLYDNIPLIINKKLNIGYYMLIGVMLFFSLFLLNKTYQFREWQNYKAKIVTEREEPILNAARDMNVKVVIFAADLSIESYCSPFKIKKIFSEHALYLAGWMTNNPLNKGHFDSYMSFVDSDTYIFASLRRVPNSISSLQYALNEHYSCDTEHFELLRSEYNLLFQLKRK